MQRVPVQGQTERYYQQHPVQSNHFRQLNHVVSSPAPIHNKVHHLSPPSVSATIDRRTVGNSTVSPPSFYTQRRHYDNSAYNRGTFECTDSIEPFPNNRRNTLSPGHQSTASCRVNLYGGSASSIVQHSIPGVPSTVQLDATVTCLWVLTPLTATLSAVIVLVAITTNQWLHTEEKMNNPSYNGTGDRDYLSKLTVSGLWKLCYTNPGEKNFECSKIDYFPKEEYAPDPNDSTMAIPYAVTKSSFFLLLATAVLFAGYICCAVGHCARHRRIYTFTSGVLFIVSGLLMLIGLVMYISVFKAEIGSKLRQPSFTQPPIFTYRYGYSFLLYVSGFITIEMAGTSAVFLFIYWYQKDWVVKLSEMAREKYAQGSESSISYTNLDQGPVYPCKRHPYTIQRTQPVGAACEPSTSKAYISPSKQRRYFFDKDSFPPVSPSCSLHRNKNVCVSTSLRDVSASTCYEFPPAPHLNGESYIDPYNGEFLDMSKGYNTSHDSFLTNVGSTRSLHAAGGNNLPRDATTNTVSTTADVINSCDEFGFGESASSTAFVEDFSPGIQHEHEFVTFDLERPIELRPGIVSIGLQANRKEYVSGSDTLRRTTPV